MNPYNPYSQNVFFNPGQAMSNSASASMFHPMQQLAGNPMMNGANTLAQASGLSKLSKTFAGFNYATFLDGTQKTLTTINQIIPLVNQVSPMVRNASTMFRVANEVKRMSAEPSPTATIPQPTMTEQPIIEVIVPTSQTISPPIPDQPTYFK